LSSGRGAYFREREITRGNSGAFGIAGRARRLLRHHLVKSTAARRELSERGFTVVELLTVVAIVSIISAIVIGGFSAYAATVQGDSDMRTVEWQLKLARETAINQRRSVEVQFTAPNHIVLVRHNLPAGTTVVSTIYLEHGAAFMFFGNQPDTPDRFGRATEPVAFGAAQQILFTADGMLTDELGNPLNGTVFLGEAGRPMSARALTVFGPTARIRSYRWNGAAWRP
jgi:prepilin-type N-terminal cleavage/methylation domain-containing protein